MISSLLPAAVEAVHTQAPGDPERLPALEAAALGRAAPRRAAEFAAGRQCARLALSRLGVQSGPLLRGPDREPSWPGGVVGSITHCRGYCAAAVARASSIATIGIDAELHDVLPDGVLERIALPDESAWILAQAGDVCWDRVLFSAKESVFKAWFPLTRRWLEFEGARIKFTPRRDASAASPRTDALPAVRLDDRTPARDAATTGTFEATLLVPGPTVDGAALAGFRGRFLVQGGFVLTAIAMARG